jgi:hypothetical protein
MPTSSSTLRRTTGALFVVGAVAFAVAATVLSATFDWPDVLRRPAAEVLPAFADGDPALVRTWAAVGWTYALLAVPVLLLPAALGRHTDPALRVATHLGVASVLVSLVGFLRWVFVVPGLAESSTSEDPAVRAATAVAWTTQHQFGGALLGEHLGQLLAVAWSVTIAVVVLRTGALPRWLGVTGLVASLVYLLNQGDVLATAVPGFPVWEPAGFLGSSLWGLWVVALGVCVWRRSPARARPAAQQHTPDDAGEPTRAVVRI